MPIRDDSTFDAVRHAGIAKLQPGRPRIAVGMGTCGTGNGAEGVFHAFDEAIGRRGLDVQLVQTGCFGFCAEEPLVNVWVPGQALVILHRVRPDQVGQILDGMTGRALAENLILCKVEQWDHITARLDYGSGYGSVLSWDEVPFFKGQQKIVLRNCGLIAPDDIEEYIAIGGYASLRKVLRDSTPEQVNEQLKAARLRGRGGAGFSTGIKFEYLRKGCRRPKILDLQCRRGRSRRVYEPQRAGERSALAAR